MILTYSFVILFTILKQYIDGLAIKNILDDLVPQIDFEGDVIQYNLRRYNSSSEKLELVNLILHGKDVKTKKVICPQSNVINSSSNIELANDFECIKVKSIILAVLVNDLPFKEVWPANQTYCSNTPWNYSIYNFCHQNAYSKTYKTVKIKLYSYPNRLEKSLAFKADGFVYERKWFNRGNCRLNFSELSLQFSNIFVIEELNTLFQDPYNIYVNQENGKYVIKYSEGQHFFTKNGLKNADYLVIYGIV
ncbi:hypothetical protein SNEBB_011420 [Seison nebaliae]|nr:hypothetical protein SNEBB_011420 [Seison nebaliae]